jgi:hypothetical protein
VTLGCKVIDHREVERGAIGKIDPHFVMTAFEHVKEGGAAPISCSIAVSGRPVFEALALVGFTVVPAKSAPLENRVQRIDEDQPARQLEALRAAALAEAANEIILRHAGQALAHQPVHQAQSRCQVHEILCRVMMRHDNRGLLVGKGNCHGSAAKNCPPAAQISTTSQGGVRHIISSRKATAASAKSPLPRMAVSHTGL